MRGYKLIDKNQSEVKHHERRSALQNKTKTHKKILPFVTEYRPSGSMSKKHHHEKMVYYIKPTVAQRNL